ncbi:hypothetical protein [Frankia sp. QA3]|uniref:hypothetical protein n=1 Tax=Frankia sp. QA3 TaxID=710111 RepID=UPI000269C815|nr:hypothetical protein [Frankia sp. QA3]EIV94551.1 hypothetical protein FraQA3DRAFT_4308 [Frankia sp. QA3]
MQDRPRPAKAAFVSELARMRGEWKASFTKLGEKIKVHRMVVSAACRGEQHGSPWLLPSRQVVEGLDRELHAAGRLVQLWQDAVMEHTALQIKRKGVGHLPAGNSTVVERPAAGEENPTDADRRQFVELAALSTLAFETTRRIDASGAAPTLGELEDDMADIAASFDTTPRLTLIAEVAGRWKQVEAMLDGDNQRLTVTDSLRTTRLGGQLTYYLGRLAFTGGHYRDARRFADLSDRYAAQIDDDILIGSLAALRSSIAYYTHRWDDAATIAGRARRAAPPYLAARLAAYEARGQARLGRVHATESALTAMREAAGAATTPRPGSSPFTAGSAAMFAAVCAIELGDGAEVRHRAQQAVDLLDPRSHEERGHAYLCLATGVLLQDRPDPAAAVAASRAAAAVPDGHLSATIVSAMTEVMRDLNPWASDPDVSALGALVHQVSVGPSRVAPAGALE